MTARFSTTQVYNFKRGISTTMAALTSPIDSDNVTHTITGAGFGLA